MSLVFGTVFFLVCVECIKFIKMLMSLISMCACVGGAALVGGWMCECYFYAVFICFCRSFSVHLHVFVNELVLSMLVHMKISYCICVQYISFH